MADGVCDHQEVSGKSCAFEGLLDIVAASNVQRRQIGIGRISTGFNGRAGLLDLVDMGFQR